MASHHNQEFIESLKKPKGRAPHQLVVRTFNQYVTISTEKNQVIINGNNPNEPFPDITFNKDDVFEKDIIFDGGNFSKIIFRGGTFKGNLIFRNGTYNGFISIRGGDFQKKLVFLGGDFKHWVGTLDGKGNKNNPQDAEELAEDPLHIHNLEIEGGSVVNNFWINGGTIDNLEIKSVTAARIHIKSSDDLLESGEKKFNSAPKIGTLAFLRYFHKDSFVQVSGVTISELRFEEFTNLGNISITDLTIEEGKKIVMNNADLGRTTFTDCDFQNNMIEFKSSQMSGILVAGTSWAGLKNLIVLDKQDEPAQQRLFLRQLKKVYEERRDWLRAGKYHALEMNVHAKTLTYEKNLWEKLVINLNRITNNHGQSWSRALLVIIISLIILFPIYCAQLGFVFDPCLKDASMNRFWELFKLSPEFLNPIRKSEFLPKVITGSEKINANVILVDTISRIIFAYLLFQFIAAFRKHGRTK